MTNSQNSDHNIDQIGEFTVKANPRDLNEALAKKGILVSRIISVMFISGTVIAGGSGDEYRVIYRN